MTLSNSKPADNHRAAEELIPELCRLHKRLRQIPAAINRPVQELTGRIANYLLQAYLSTDLAAKEAAYRAALEAANQAWHCLAKPPAWNFPAEPKKLLLKDLKILRHSIRQTLAALDIRQQAQTNEPEH